MQKQKKQHKNLLVLSRNFKMFRFMTMQDYTKLYALNQALFAKPLLLNIIYFGIVKEINEQIQGAIYCQYLAPECEIIALATDKNCTNQGIGGQLIRHLTQLCPPNARIFLEVSDKNSNALYLYQKSGFKPINTRKNYYPDGSDAIVMELNMLAPIPH